MKLIFLIQVHRNDPDDIINLVMLHKQLFLDFNNSHKCSLKISKEIIDSIKKW